jgi:hypothetical protein
MKRPKFPLQRSLGSLPSATSATCWSSISTLLISHPHSTLAVGTKSSPPSPPSSSDRLHHGHSRGSCNSSRWAIHRHHEGHWLPPLEDQSIGGSRVCKASERLPCKSGRQQPVRPERAMKRTWTRARRRRICRNPGNAMGELPRAQDGDRVGRRGLQRQTRPDISLKAHLADIPGHRLPGKRPPQASPPPPPPPPPVLVSLSAVVGCGRMGFGGCREEREERSQGSRVVWVDMQIFQGQCETSWRFSTDETRQTPKRTNNENFHVEARSPVRGSTQLQEQNLNRKYAESFNSRELNALSRFGKAFFEWYGGRHRCHWYTSMLFWFCPLTYCSTGIYIEYHTSGEFFSMCFTLS